MEKIGFMEIVDYAERDKGFRKRQDKSHAKDIRGNMYRFYGNNILVLYEGERRILRGHLKPEVCWICINSHGLVSSIAARHLRSAMPVQSFSFCSETREEFLRRREEVK